MQYKSSLGLARGFELTRGFENTFVATRFWLNLPWPTTQWTYISLPRPFVRFFLCNPVAWSPSASLWMGIPSTDGMMVKSAWNGNLPVWYRCAQSIMDSLSPPAEDSLIERRMYLYIGSCKAGRISSELSTWRALRSRDDKAGNMKYAVRDSKRSCEEWEWAWELGFRFRLHYVWLGLQWLVSAM